MRTILFLVPTIALGLAGSARAECRQEDDSPATTRIEMINGKSTIVITKDIVICGHPPRPAVAYVTSAKNVEYAWTQLTEDLAGKIVDSVKQLVGGNK